MKKHAINYSLSLSLAISSFHVPSALATPDENGFLAGASYEFVSGLALGQAFQVFDLLGFPPPAVYTDLINVASAIEVDAYGLMDPRYVPQIHRFHPSHIIANYITCPNCEHQTLVNVGLKTEKASVWNRHFESGQQAVQAAVRRANAFISALRLVARTLGIDIPYFYKPAEQEIAVLSSGEVKFTFAELSTVTNAWADQISFGKRVNAFVGRLPDRRCVDVQRFHDADGFSTALYRLRKVNHPNVIRHIGYCEESKKYCIVFPLCEKITEKNVKVLARFENMQKLAEGLQALHAANIVLGNLDPEDVLLVADSEEPLLFVLDHKGNKAPPSVGGFQAPEVTTLPHITRSSDVYSLGVMFICFYLKKLKPIKAFPKEERNNARSALFQEGTRVLQEAKLNELLQRVQDPFARELWNAPLKLDT